VAERRNFLDALEPFIYLNSSFVIALRAIHDPFHHECRLFFDRLQAEGTVCVVSDFVYNKVAFYILRRTLIQEALKRKGWTYPPTEEMKRQWKEAWDRIIGRGSTDPEIMEELWREMGWRRRGRKAQLP
jgi:predicted nucleic acid-binding protein